MKPLTKIQKAKERDNMAVTEEEIAGHLCDDEPRCRICLLLLRIEEDRATIRALEDAIMPEHDLGIDFESCCGRERSHNVALAIISRRGAK